MTLNINDLIADTKVIDSIINYNRESIELIITIKESEIDEYSEDMYLILSDHNFYYESNKLIIKIK